MSTTYNNSSTMSTNFITTPDVPNKTASIEAAVRWIKEADKYTPEQLTRKINYYADALEHYTDSESYDEKFWDMNYQLEALETIENARKLTNDELRSCINSYCRCFGASVCTTSVGFLLICVNELSKRNEDSE